MREVKFRAWNKEFESMMYSEMVSEEYDFRFTESGLEVFGYSDDFTRPMNVDLMQYTGLKDKNGQELYFDDCVNFIQGNRKDTLVWDIRNVSDLAYLICDLEEMRANFEIIGNIHENPELLEEAK